MVDDSSTDSTPPLLPGDGGVLRCSEKHKTLRDLHLLGPHHLWLVLRGREHDDQFDYRELRNHQEDHLPEEIFPIAAVGAALVNFGLQMVILLVAAAFVGTIVFRSLLFSLLSVLIVPPLRCWAGTLPCGLECLPPRYPVHGRGCCHVADGLARLSTPGPLWPMRSQCAVLAGSQMCTSTTQ